MHFRFLAPILLAFWIAIPAETVAQGPSVISANEARWVRLFQNLPISAVWMAACAWNSPIAPPPMFKV
jgi:hypothetical protein